MTGEVVVEIEHANQRPVDQSGIYRRRALAHPYDRAAAVAAHGAQAAGQRNAVGMRGAGQSGRGGVEHHVPADVRHGRGQVVRVVGDFSSETGDALGKIGLEE